MSNLAIYKTKPKFVIDDNIVSVLAVIILSFTVIGDYVPVVCIMYPSIYIQNKV